MKKLTGLKLGGLAVLATAWLLLERQCSKEQGHELRNRVWKTSDEVSSVLGEWNNVSSRTKKRDWVKINSENPEKLEWQGKVSYSRDQVWENLFAIYDFPHFAIFEYDMAVWNGTKRMIFYAKKGMNQETHVTITEKTEWGTNMKIVSKQIPQLFFSWEYAGSVKLINGGIEITKDSPRSEPEESIIEDLNNDYNTFWLKNNP